MVNSSGMWDKYKDSGDTDITEYFFEKPDRIVQQVNSVYCDVDQQFVDYNSIDFFNTKGFVRKYFSPSQRVKDYKKLLINKYNINLDRTISIFFRAHDKSGETPIPTYEEMFVKIKEIKEKHKDYRLLVQSADPVFCEMVVKQYEDTIVFKEIMKFDVSVMQELGTMVPDGKKKEQALIFLSIILIISNSAIIILNSCNIGIWIVFFRESTNNVHQYLKGFWFNSNK